MSNSTLKKINLSTTNFVIDESNSKAFAQNSTLIKLNLSKNKIRKEGVG